MTPQEFYQLLSQQGIELTDRQKDQFERYFELLVGQLDSLLGQ